jgi:hypothetical protein
MAVGLLFGLVLLATVLRHCRDAASEKPGVDTRVAPKQEASDVQFMPAAAPASDFGVKPPPISAPTSGRVPYSGRRFEQRKSWGQGYRPPDSESRLASISGVIDSQNGSITKPEVIIEWVYSWDAWNVPPPIGVLTRIDEEGTRWIRKTANPDETGHFSIKDLPATLLRVQVGSQVQAVRPNETVHMGSTK